MFNTTGIINTSGTVQERFKSDAFGSYIVLNASWAVTTDTKQWVYVPQGKRFDTVLRQYDSRHRIVSVDLMRALQPDPKGYPDGANRYWWEMNNPINRMDPSGLAALSLKSADFVDATPPVEDQNGLNYRSRFNFENLQLGDVFIQHNSLSVSFKSGAVSLHVTDVLVIDERRARGQYIEDTVRSTGMLLEALDYAGGKRLIQQPGRPDIPNGPNVRPCEFLVFLHATATIYSGAQIRRAVDGPWTPYTKNEYGDTSMLFREKVLYTSPDDLEPTYTYFKDAKIAGVQGIGVPRITWSHEDTVIMEEDGRGGLKVKSYNISYSSTDANFNQGKVSLNRASP
jgi:RHS repeat-associated protein